MGECVSLLCIAVTFFSLIYVDCCIKNPSIAIKTIILV